MEKADQMQKHVIFQFPLLGSVNAGEIYYRSDLGLSIPFIGFIGGKRGNEDEIGYFQFPLLGS